jgi:hypothetical protein
MLNVPPGSSGSDSLPLRARSASVKMSGAAILVRTVR